MHTDLRPLVSKENRRDLVPLVASRIVAVQLGVFAIVIKVLQVVRSVPIERLAVDLQIRLVAVLGANDIDSTAPGARGPLARPLIPVRRGFSLSFSYSNRRKTPQRPGARRRVVYLQSRAWMFPVSCLQPPITYSRARRPGGRLMKRIGGGFHTAAKPVPTKQLHRIFR